MTIEGIGGFHNLLFIYMNKASPPIKGIYRHFKGNEYELLEIATDSETLESLVVYKSTKDGKVWARPLEMFNEEVENNGKRVKRFQYVGKL